MDQNLRKVIGVGLIIAGVMALSYAAGFRPRSRAEPPGVPEAPPEIAPIAGSDIGEAAAS